MGNEIISNTELSINLTGHFDPKHIYNIIKKRANSKDLSPRQKKEYNYTEDLKNWEDEDLFVEHLSDSGIHLGYFYDQFGSFDYAWYLAIVLSFIATAVHLPIDERPLATVDKTI